MEDLVRDTVAEALKRGDEFDAASGPEALRDWVRAIYDKLAAASEFPGKEAPDLPLFEQAFRMVEKRGEVVAEVVRHGGGFCLVIAWRKPKGMR